jgi:limonene-1,2-epoxide hydrolase
MATATATTTETRTTDPIQVVEAFLDALERVDIDEAGTYLADDMVWHNVPFPPAEGKEKVIGQLKGMNRFKDTEFAVEMVNIAANGPVVLTERLDTLRAGPVGGEFWVCGTFEVHDGLITLWRDRFDFANIAGKTISGTARNLWARLRDVTQSAS